MADNLKWFKVWTHLLTDPEFDDIENWCIGVWVRLGALVATHGTGGTIELTERQFLKRTNIEKKDIENVQKCLKNINVNIEKYDNGTFCVSYSKWRYYQIDTTGYERVKKHRNKQNDNGPRQDKTRQDKTRDIYVTFFEDFWKIYPSRNGKKLGKQSALKRLKTHVKPSDFDSLLKATQNYSQSKQVKEGYAKDAERFIYSRGEQYWREWLDKESISTEKARCVYDKLKPCYFDCNNCNIRKDQNET